MPPDSVARTLCKATNLAQFGKRKLVRTVPSVLLWLSYGALAKRNDHSQRVHHRAPILCEDDSVDQLLLNVTFIHGSSACIGCCWITSGYDTENLRNPQYSYVFVAHHEFDKSGPVSSTHEDKAKETSTRDH